MNNAIINNKGLDYFANISSSLDFIKVDMDQCMIGKLYKFNKIICNLEKENDVIQCLTILYKYYQYIYSIYDRDKEAYKDYTSLVQWRVSNLLFDYPEVGYLLLLWHKEEDINTMNQKIKTAVQYKFNDITVSSPFMDNIVLLLITHINTSSNVRNENRIGVS